MKPQNKDPFISMKPKINQYMLFEFDDEHKTQVVFRSLYAGSDSFIAKVQIWDAQEACTLVLFETITKQIPTVDTANLLYELVYQQGGVK
jgi:hypothetical protein